MKPDRPREFSCDVLLLCPPAGGRIISMANVGVEYIAASARAAGLTAEVVNSGLHGLDELQTLSVLLNGDFRVLAVSTLHQTYISGLWLAKQVKQRKPRVKIIFGGLEAGLRGRDVLEKHDYIDAVGTGEGEHTVTAYCKSVMEGGRPDGIPGLLFRSGRGIRANGPAELIQDLDSLPRPAHDDTRCVMELGGPVTISSSRGCFGRCKFCSITKFYGLSRGKPWRCRSAGSVVDEIEEVKKRYGADLFGFIDETVAGPGSGGIERLASIAELLLSRGLEIEFYAAVRATQVNRPLFRLLKRAGLCKVEIGVESMSAPQLKRYNKSVSVQQNREALEILDSLDIACESFLIPFDPEATVGDLRANLDFLEERCRLARRKRSYIVTPLQMAQYMYPYTGTEAELEYRRKYGGAGRYYLEYRAEDPAMEAVQGLLALQLNICDTAFPASSYGFGNLWRRKIGVSAADYAELSSCTSDFGLALVGYARRMLAYLARKRRPGFDRDLSLFGSLNKELLEATGLTRSRVRRIAAKYRAVDRLPAAPCGYGSSFSGRLRAYSRPISRQKLGRLLAAQPDFESVFEKAAGVLERFEASR